MYTKRNNKLTKHLDKRFKRFKEGNNDLIVLPRDNGDKNLNSRNCRSYKFTVLMNTHTILGVMMIK